MMNAMNSITGTLFEQQKYQWFLYLYAHETICIQFYHHFRSMCHRIHSTEMKACTRKMARIVHNECIDAVELAARIAFIRFDCADTKWFITKTQRLIFFGVSVIVNLHTEQIFNRKVACATRKHQYRT